jgi:hypothetical protein
MPISGIEADRSGTPARAATDVDPRPSESGSMIDKNVERPTVLSPNEVKISVYIDENKEDNNWHASCIIFCAVIYILVTK